MTSVILKGCKVEDLQAAAAFLRSHTSKTGDEWSDRIIKALESAYDLQSGKLERKRVARLSRHYNVPFDIIDAALNTASETEPLADAIARVQARGGA